MVAQAPILVPGARLPIPRSVSPELGTRTFRRRGRVSRWQEADPSMRSDVAPDGGRRGSRWREAWLPMAHA
jgi:hypothetical protein